MRWLARVGSANKEKCSREALSSFGLRSLLVQPVKDRSIPHQQAIKFASIGEKVTFNLSCTISTDGGAIGEPKLVTYETINQSNAFDLY